VDDDQYKVPVALVRLCEWAVEGTFAPSGFHRTTGECVDPLDVLDAARAALKGVPFTEQWNFDERGLHPVTALPEDPGRFIETLIVSAADAARFRSRFAPPPFRGLFGSIVGRLSASPPMPPPRCPHFDDIEARAKEERLQKARTAFSQWAPPAAKPVPQESGAQESEEAEPSPALPPAAVASPHQPALEAPPAVTGTPGRPEKYISLVLAEFHRRVKAGRVEPSLAGQSRELQSWFHATHPEKQAPTAKTIENRLRAEYRESQSKTSHSPQRPSPK
jgi:hypothetical protein